MPAQTSRSRDISISYGNLHIQNNQFIFTIMYSNLVKIWFVSMKRRFLVSHLLLSIVTFYSAFIRTHTEETSQNPSWPDKFNSDVWRCDQYDFLFFLDKMNLNLKDAMMCYTIDKVPEQHSLRDVWNCNFYSEVQQIAQMAYSYHYIAMVCCLRVFQRTEHDLTHLFY